MTTLDKRAEKTRIPLPPATVLAARMDAGESSRAIAREYRCSPTTITLAIRDSGVREPKPERIDLAALAQSRADMEWQAEALCVGYDPSWWFPEVRKMRGRILDTPESLVAKQICAECPVRARCAEYATENREVGIWGGVLRGDR